MKSDADVESDACGQEKLENIELCKRSGAGEELVKNERDRRPPILYLRTLNCWNPMRVL